MWFVLFIVIIAIIINILFGEKYIQYAKNKAGESGEKSLAFWFQRDFLRPNIINNKEIIDVIKKVSISYKEI